MRANKLWAQVEATFKQMDTGETELECFRALKKQELLAATHRISNLWEEVQKQKDLERTLQKRYGDLYTELERVQNLITAHRLQAEREQEDAAKDNDLAMDDSETSRDQSVAPDLEVPQGEVVANNNDIAMEDADAEDQRVASDVGTSKEEVVAKDMVDADAAEDQLADSDVETSKQEVVAKDMVEAEIDAAEDQPVASDVEISKEEGVSKVEAEGAGDEGVAPTAELEGIQNKGDSIEAHNTDETRDQGVDAAYVDDQLRSEDGNDATEENAPSATGGLQTPETAGEA